MRHDKSELEADDFDDVVLKFLTDDIPDWRYRLLLAKARGSDDHTAADFAGLTEAEFDHYVQYDATLERDLRAVRAGAFLRHLRRIGSVPQWQAHEFLLNKLWPDSSASEPAKSSEEAAMEVSVRRVARKLTLPQLQQPA